MRILILGGNGMIGHKVYQVLSSYFPDTWILIRRKFIDFLQKDIFVKEKVIEDFDLNDLNKLNSLLNSLNPDIIINAAGITIRRGVNEFKSQTIILNSVLPHFLGEWIQGKFGKRFIHFSTDCVFSGKNGPYYDNSIPDSTDIYGKTKSLGEVNLSQTLTLRGSMIGRELDYQTELLEWFLSQKGKTIKGFNNVFYSGITTIRMAKLILKIIINFPNLTGVYNVSSKKISKFELLTLFNDFFHSNVKIHKDETYTSRKELISNIFFYEINEIIPSWDELIIELYEDSNLNINIYKN